MHVHLFRIFSCFFPLVSEHFQQEGFFSLINDTLAIFGRGHLNDLTSQMK